MADPEEIKELFEKTFIPVSDAWRVLNYSHQYARRLINEVATDEVDFFTIHGRQYITQDLVDRLRARASKQ